MEIFSLQSGNHSRKSFKKEKMEKIKLYCVNKIILGWKVGQHPEIDGLMLIYLIFRAETEKGLSRKHVIEGLRASLERLQLDYVDIVFANKPDTSVPMEGS